MLRLFLWALTARFTRAIGCSYSRSKISWSGRPASWRCESGGRGGQPFSRLLTRLVSLADTVVRPSRRRVRLVGLCSSRCRRLACWRRILPVPVRRNRFAAPLWVFTLGMFPLFYEVPEIPGEALGLAG